MTRLRRYHLTAVVPLVVWTFFVWGPRINNIWGDDTLTSSGKWARTAVAVVFLALAAAVGAMLWRRRGVALGSTDKMLVVTFAVWAIGYWTVRGIEIIAADHGLGFTLVHTALWLVSAVLAVSALGNCTRDATPRRAVERGARVAPW